MKNKVYRKSFVLILALMIILNYTSCMVQAIENNTEFDNGKVDVKAIMGVTAWIKNAYTDELVTGDIEYEIRNERGALISEGYTDNGVVMFTTTDYESSMFYIVFTEVPENYIQPEEPQAILFENENIVYLKELPPLPPAIRTYTFQLKDSETEELINEEFEYLIIGEDGITVLSDGATENGIITFTTQDYSSEPTYIRFIYGLANYVVPNGQIPIGEYGIIHLTKFTSIGEAFRVVTFNIVNKKTGNNIDAICEYEIYDEDEKLVAYGTTNDDGTFEFEASGTIDEKYYLRLSNFEPDIYFADFDFYEFTLNDSSFKVEVLKGLKPPYIMLLKGDLNGDGKVNSTDAVIAINYYQNAGDVDSINQTFLFAVGDMNNDGKINSSDASLILKYYNEGIEEMIKV